MGAALVAQAMSGGEVTVRYKAMKAVKDWDRTRLNCTPKLGRLK